MLLLLHVLMLSLLSGGSARVVQKFEDECGQFFANEKPPTRFAGEQYRQICQMQNYVDYYATFYDTDKRIPLYSAYKFKEIKNCTRLNNWYIEPQLDDDNGSPNMQFENEKIQGLGVHQALDEDYRNSGYDRGHLAPVFQAQSQSCADATFTLTNAAPQNPSFNRGVVPGTKNISDRVKVPSHFWTAFCCLDNNKKCQISRGFIGVNENITSKNETVKDLEKELETLYKVKSFKLFDNSTEPPAKKKKSKK